MSAIQDLARLLENICADTVAAGELLSRAFPVGTEVFWQVGETLRYATVISHSRDLLKVKVRGRGGRSIYWVTAQALAKWMK